MYKPFGVTFDIAFFQQKKTSNSYSNGFVGEIPVFVYIQVINRAPDSPRMLRKNMYKPFGVTFDITFFLKLKVLHEWICRGNTCIIELLEPLIVPRR